MTAFTTTTYSDHPKPTTQSKEAKSSTPLQHPTPTRRSTNYNHRLAQEFETLLIEDLSDDENDCLQSVVRAPASTPHTNEVPSVQVVKEEPPVSLASYEILTKEEYNILVQEDKAFDEHDSRFHQSAEVEELQRDISTLSDKLGQSRKAFQHEIKSLTIELGDTNATAAVLRILNEEHAQTAKPLATKTRHFQFGHRWVATTTSSSKPLPPSIITRRDGTGQTISKKHNKGRPKKHIRWNDACLTETKYIPTQRHASLLWEARYTLPNGKIAVHASDFHRLVQTNIEMRDVATENFLESLHFRKQTLHSQLDLARHLIKGFRRALKLVSESRRRVRKEQRRSRHAAWRGRLPTYSWTIAPEPVDGESAVAIVNSKDRLAEYIRQHPSLQSS